MPELEYWTFGTEVPQDQMAINLGAPGDRRGPNGKMWLEYPEVGGPSANAPITVEPANAATFRLHSSAVKGNDLKWVAASGLRGVKSVKLKLKKKGTYRVRLHFLEPDKLPASARLFDIVINGQTVQRQFDITARAGSSLSSIVCEYTTVSADGIIEIKFQSITAQPPLLSGIKWWLLPLTSK
jgi:hypothetical protein